MSTPPPPSVTTLSPPSGSTAGGTQVTIYGSNFTGASAVRFGSAQTNVVTVTETYVTANAPQAPAGTVDVQVNGPAGWSAKVSTAQFTYLAPKVTGVSPNNGPVAGGTLVTVSGKRLSGATAVQFGGVQATVVSATDDEVTAHSPSVAAGGIVPIEVVLSTGPTAPAPGVTFQYLAPTVSKIKPTAGSMEGGTEVTIIGTQLGNVTAVQFGGVGAPGVVTVVSDGEIKVKSPAVTSPQTVGVQVNLPTGLVPASASAAPQFTYSPPGPPKNAQFVIVNKTTVPDELVFVKFLGAEINANETEQSYGSYLPLNAGAQTADKSYSLAEMTGITGIGALPNQVPTFGINDYSGGRIYFSLVKPLQTTTIPAAQTPGGGDFNTVYGYVEPSVFPNRAAGNTNLDTSYVDFVGLPISIAIKNSADGSLAHPPANNPLLTPSGSVLFDVLTRDTNVPSATRIAASGSGTTPSKTVSIGGTARILSPSLYQSSLIAGAQPYHGWTGPGELIATMRASGTILNVGSYVTTDSAATVPSGTLFGFSGSTATSPISTAWVAAQSYSLTAEAVADLNPKGTNPRISQLAGKAGIHLKGSADSVGKFDVYLTDTDLNDRKGVYGANPPYVVDWTGQSGGAQAYSLTEIANDLSGRVVGDLLAGFNFGWATCATTVAAQASASGTEANLANSVFATGSGALADTPIGALSTGQFFYLLSLQPNTVDVAKWFGQSIQLNNAEFYNNYSSDFQSLTNCYNMAFTDRLQGPSDPDMFFTPGNETYVEITLLPGAYTVSSS